MKNKKTIMSVSAILILIFHLWISITNSITETVIRQICVVGVDLFFFVSIYGISKKDKINYKEFILNRLKNVYFKFAILTIIAAVISSWSLKKLFLTIFGINLFRLGGGSFLWFLPGIMIIYFLIPLYKKIADKKPLVTLIVSILIYIIFSLTISICTYYDEIFILTNRIPIMIIAYYFGKYNLIEKLDKNKIFYWITTMILVIIGVSISYYSTLIRIEVEWFYDIFYILNIPLEIGLILFLNKIKDNKITEIIGKSTLELYGLQMMFGFKIVNKLYFKLNNVILTNLCMIIIFILMAIVLKFIFDQIFKISKYISKIYLKK